jgi:hypothetical protein
MSNTDPDDESADSQQESEQQPVDTDQPSAQSDEQPAEQTDQSTEQSEDQSADTDQATDQAEEQPSDSDQATDQSEEQPAESDQPAAEAEEQPTESEQPADQSEEQSAEGDRLVAQAEGAPMGDDSAGQADTQPALSPAPKGPYKVESWRPLVTEMAGDIPVEVLLRWIKHESGGNPCSTGAPAKSGGGSIENGIFQLYSPDDDHLATPAQLHGSFCSGQTCTRDLTLDEARIQVASGIAYVRSCRERARAQLKQAGVTWGETGKDFWSLVKMQHNLPSVPKQYIPKLRPTSWSDFKQGVLKAQPNYANTTIFSNAEDIGAAAV